MPGTDPPICDYEASDYQSSFWDRGGREYEDQVEAIALKRLLPASGGGLLLELGAGAGRNTPRYEGFQRVVLLDFSLSQLQQAQSRLGTSERYVYVAADVYRLPFLDGVFDAGTMIRVLHHMADAPRALSQVHSVLRPDATFILEFANKRNFKSVLRYWLGQQTWNPFSPEPVEFARLNFDFHPREVQLWLEQLGFEVQRKLSVSHFRSHVMKRLLPLSILVWADARLQPTGAWWQYTPSVFYQARGGNDVAHAVGADADPLALLKCPACGNAPLVRVQSGLDCGQCGRAWGMIEGIYDFRRPTGESGVTRRMS